MTVKEAKIHNGRAWLHLRGIITAMGMGVATKMAMGIAYE